MATQNEYINQIIENALTIAGDATADANTAANAIIDAADGASISGGSFDKVTTGAEEPDIPNTDSNITDYQSNVNYIVTLLSNQLAGFFDKYYPLQSDAFDEATDWLVDTITNGGTGIPVEVERQIWQRARDAVNTEYSSTEADIVSGFSARGISLPSGVMDKRVREARLASARTVSGNAVDIAAKQADIQIDTIKFAIEQAIKSRTMAMNAAADYIRAIASAPDSAARLLDIDNGAQARAMSATADLYRARLSRDELVLKTDTARYGLANDIFNSLINKNRDDINGKVQATIGAADTYAKVAQSALSSLNSVVSTAVNSFG